MTETLFIDDELATTLSTRNTLLHEKHGDFSQLATELLWPPFICPLVNSVSLLSWSACLWLNSLSSFCLLFKNNGKSPSRGPACSKKTVDLRRRVERRGITPDFPCQRPAWSRQISQAPVHGPSLHISTILLALPSASAYQRPGTKLCIRPPSNASFLYFCQTRNVPISSPISIHQHFVICTTIHPPPPTASPPRTPGYPHVTKVEKVLGSLLALPSSFAVHHSTTTKTAFYFLPAHLFA